MPAPSAPAPSAEPPPAAEESAAVVAAEDALTQAVVGLSPEAHASLLGQVVEVSMREGLTWERPTGGYDPVPLMLRPRVWTVAQSELVRRACLAVQGALGRMLRLWLEDAEARVVLPLTGYEEGRLRDLAGRSASLDDPCLFARLDAILDCSSARWERSLAFLEPNVVGVGGTRYTALGEQVWMEAVHPRFPAVAVEPHLDSRRLLLDHLLDRARVVGIAGVPRLALVEDLRETFGTNELRQIAAYFTRQGVPAVHVDVRSLEYRGDQLHASGLPVDLIYRFPELRELEELDHGPVLEPLWRAFLENRVVSTLAGDFDHKSVFEILTSPRWQGLFSLEDQRIFRRHVLWTRLVSARRTDSPEGAEVDLPEFIRSGREGLVLKPNRSYGGDGVTLGPETPQPAWEQALQEALAVPGAWVVQQYRALPRQQFPFREGTGWKMEERVMVSGFYATARGVTSMGRVSQQSVVNLSRPGSALVPQVKIR